MRMGASWWMSLFLAGCTCAGGPSTGPNDAATKAEIPAAPEGAPNVLVVVLDTVRADHLSVYGYDRETTPHLAAFAESARVYERAVSPGMWTLPSHASLFTGLPVSGHGATAQHKWLDDDFTTFAEHFGGSGWRTYLFSANPYLNDHTNLGQGFELREFPWSERWKKPARRATMGKLLDDDASNSLGPKWDPTEYKTGRHHDKVKDAGDVAADALLAFVDERAGDAPWLGVLNYMEAHVPRIPSMASRQALFDEATIASQLTLDQSFGYLLAYTVGKHDYTDDEVAIVGTTYDASLRDLDAALGTLFDRLEAKGVLDDTIVVVTADHGEHLGEHHRIGHKYSVYNPLIRVPLIVRYPKGIEPGREPRIVSTLSVFATLADLAGLEVPEQVVMPSLRDPAAYPEAAFSELVHATPQALRRIARVHPDLDWEPFLRTYTSAETENAKCILSGDGDRELYAMPDDALEVFDLAVARPELADEVCGRIGPWRDTFTAWTKGDGGEQGRPLDAEMKERLEALGYMEDDE